MNPNIKTTVVGSYPVPSWLVGNTSRLVLRDAVMAVLKMQELAGLDLLTDGELMRFDPSHPETNGMVDYFVAQMEGIRSHFALSDFDRFRSDRASAARLLTAGMVVGKIGGDTLNIPDLAMDLAAVLRRQLESIEADVVQLDEACIAGYPQDSSWAAEAINHVLDGISRIPRMDESGVELLEQNRARQGARQASFDIRRRDFRRQRVQFQHQQAEPSYIGCPPPQVAGQIFFQLVARNLFSEVGERSAGFPAARPSGIIRRRNVGPVVVEERTHVEQIVDVQVQFLQVARQLRRPVNVARDYVIDGNASLPQRLLGDPPRHLVEIGADEDLSKTPAVAYDGTHGFSDQYLVELAVFLDAVKEAGLKADPRFQSKFPPSELATVSINFFTTAGDPFDAGL